MEFALYAFLSFSEKRECWWKGWCHKENLIKILFTVFPLVHFPFFHRTRPRISKWFWVLLNLSAIHRRSERLLKDSFYFLYLSRSLSLSRKHLQANILRRKTFLVCLLWASQLCKPSQFIVNKLIKKEV